MEQKFYNFDEAIEKLEISHEKLNELRESGMLRAYRDGSSWKFRGDEIEAMAQDGVPDVPPPSDIGLIDPEELVDAEPLADLDKDDDLELELADESEAEKPSSKPVPEESDLELRLDDSDTLSAGSELELVDQEDTVTADSSDVDLEAPDRSKDASDSILLSEEELGESVSESLSTIIGRKDLDFDDADLELADDVTDEEDTKLSTSSGASDIHSSKIANSGVLDDDDEDLSSAKRKFEDLEELEIDLAAESSLALDASDLAEKEEKPKKPLVADEGGSDLKLESEEADEEGNMGSTDVPLEELSNATLEVDAGSDADLDLATDDDLILADSGGSDLTLDSGDSGINLVSPSDSGLALDDIPLDVGGSAILSSLSLEGSDPEISLLGGDSNLSSLDSSAELQTDDDFQLTPLSEGGDDGDSSSQVIALDADLGSFEEEAEAGAGLLEGDAFTADADEGVVLSEDFGDAPVGEMGVGSYAGAAAMPAPEGQFTLGNILLLMAPAILLVLAGIMMLDMVRNIWSWNETYSLNSSMLDALLGMFGLN